jgi:hypothetical protein
MPDNSLFVMLDIEILVQESLGDLRSGSARNAVAIVVDHIRDSKIE